MQSDISRECVCVCVCVCVLVTQSVRLFVTPWTVAHQPSLSVGFSKQEYGSGLPFPPPRLEGVGVGRKKKRHSMYVCVHECVCVSVSVCVGFSWKASEETNEIILLLFIGKECSVLGGGVSVL